MEWTQLYQGLAAGFPVFLLVFVRVSGVLATSPFFASRAIPLPVKALSPLLLAFLLWPSLPAHTRAPSQWPQYVGAVGAEVLVGVLLGFLISLAFAVFQMAGEFVDIPIGFSLANVLDPVFGAQQSILARFLYVLATVVFFAINGHYAILMAMARSFSILPLGGFRQWPGLTELVTRYFADTFALAFQVAFPVVAAMLLTDVAFGIVNRTVPQVNVFIVGFPMKILVGLLFLAILLPFYVATVERIFSGDSQLYHLFYQVITGGGGG
ncbi:MAG: flagellar type III secretion system protein FliR [Firmicutes bacterium]|nr:flagellar type III secretion system protein FliR [Bacillota bacterium]